MCTCTLEIKNCKVLLVQSDNVPLNSWPIVVPYLVPTSDSMASIWMSLSCKLTPAYSEHDWRRVLAMAFQR